MHVHIYSVCMLYGYIERCKLADISNFMLVYANVCTYPYMYAEGHLYIYIHIYIHGYIHLYICI